MSGKGKQSSRNKYAPVPSMSTTNPICSDLGSQTGRRSGKMASTRLSYGVTTRNKFKTLKSASGYECRNAFWKWLLQSVVAYPSFGVECAFLLLYLLYCLCVSCSSVLYCCVLCIVFVLLMYVICVTCLFCCCTTATGLKPNCSLTYIYIYIYIYIPILQPLLEQQQRRRLKKLWPADLIDG
jgi:hypothetical protein